MESEGGGGSADATRFVFRGKPAAAENIPRPASRLARLAAPLLQPLRRWLLSDSGRWAHDFREWFGLAYVPR
jgi:hypothetical protein